MLIENANAGSADRSALDAALEILRTSYDVDEVQTSDREELDAALAGRGETDVIIVAGGDGSLHTTVQALYDRSELDQVTLGLIPLGTGNDFARGADIPLDPADAASVFCEGESRAVDLIVDDRGGIVINAVHLGATADASDEGRVWKSRLGKIGYAVGAMIAGAREQGLRVRITADGSEIESGKIASVAINNGAFVGAGVPLGADADPESGHLAVHVSYAYGTLSRFGYALQVRIGRHMSRSDVTELTCRSLRVAGDAFTVSTDGEISGDVSAREWTVHPGAVRMRLSRTSRGE